jgi:hypothetical protein
MPRTSDMTKVATAVTVDVRAGENHTWPRPMNVNEEFAGRGNSGVGEKQRFCHIHTSLRLIRASHDFLLGQTPEVA